MSVNFIFIVAVYIGLKFALSSRLKVWSRGGTRSQTKNKLQRQRNRN